VGVIELNRHGFLLTQKNIQFFAQNTKSLELIKWQFLPMIKKVFSCPKNLITFTISGFNAIRQSLNLIIFSFANARE